MKGDGEVGGAPGGAKQARRRARAADGAVHSFESGRGGAHRRTAGRAVDDRARAGCAYFGFIDTDLVRASFAQPSTQILQKQMPGFLRKPVPVDKAVDAIERAIDKRLARTWAPRLVGAFLAARGVLQPLSEKRLMGSNDLQEAVAQASATRRARAPSA